MDTTDPTLLVKMAANGCIRTKADAEHLRDELLRGGYERDYLPLYRAVLAILGDMQALNLPEPQHSVAMKAYLGIKREYIGTSECRCIRNATGGVAVPLTTCPVHGQTPGARLGMRNFGGLIR
jgi:hypothetical protein